jgi:phage terminase large subunit-like protein
MTDPVTQYARDVLDDKQPACKLVKQACQRHIDDLERDDIFFDAAHVRLVFEFLKLCKHYKGEWAGKPIELHPAQQFIVGNLFGWKLKNSGLRRYRTAYIELPRKNGKSTLLSALSIYLLIADQEPGAEIYAAATKEEQAKIVWNAAAEMVKKSPALSKACKTRHNSVLYPTTTSIFRPLGADSDTQDGLNPHAVINDELHAWKGRELWDVLEDAFGSRSQPLNIAITTAGFNRLGICYQQRSHCVQFLDPNSGIHDDSYFAYIATVDQEDLDDPSAKWKESTWFKANPMLGVSKNLEYMRDQANKAQAMPGKMNAFLNKQLNVWTDGQNLWLNMDKWDRCNGEVDAGLLEGRACYSGLDLSSVIDITAHVLLFPPGEYDEWTILPFFYIPEANIDEAMRRDKVPYDQWIESGFVTATPGDYIDLEFIKHDFLELSARYQIKECGYDPWKATELATALENEGAKMVVMRQGHATLVPGADALEKKILKTELRHGGNPVLRWMASNATGRQDPNGNVIPDKKNSYSRIDGVSALINAMGRAIVAGADQQSIYEKEGIFCV